MTTNQYLQTIRESLKRKIEAESPNKRIRRYVKRSKYYRQNQMFANNRKELFRNLGKEYILVEKPRKKEETETFWRNILENDREEEQKYTDTECQSWEDISQDELQTALTLHRKQATESHRALTDAVPNSWLKQLEALHQHLLSAYNHAIDTI